MSIERMKHMKESLMCCVEGQMHHLDNVDTKELGEAIDMIKDLEEAIYYCTITEAMKEKEPYDKEKEWPEENRLYMDGNGKMSKGQPRNGNQNQEMMGRNSNMRPSDRDYIEMNRSKQKDEREGRSGEVRKLYMESKEYEYSKEE
jgi:hypothetical protein